VISRRWILVCAATAMLANPLRLFGQMPGKVYRVGYLNFRAAPSAADEAFVSGMRELGYSVGRNLVIEYRWAGNDEARLPPLAGELVRLKVDVIVTAGTPATRAAMQAAGTIPIVMAAVADPVGTGLVATLGRPGGNVTGMTLQSTDLARKRLQLIRDIVPRATRIALLVRADDAQPDPSRGGSTALLVAETKAAARELGIVLLARTVANADELPDAFAQFRREQAQALIVQVSPLALDQRARIAELAVRQRLPAMYEIRNFVDAGGLVSYGPDLQDMYRRAATYVDRIFRGAKAGDLAIEQPGKFEMVINMQTANALGITFPQSVLLRADEVIR